VKGLYRGGVMGIFGKTANSPKRVVRNYKRKSKETSIEVDVLDVDGTGVSSVSTTIGFLDHMITLFSYHGLFDITLNATGDTHVDKHHLNEDIGLALGEVFKKALGECKGIVRIASQEAPMDMALARVTVDISNRPAFRFNFPEKIAENFSGEQEGYSLHYGMDFLESFAKKMGINLHIEVSGEGDLHHYLEAVFKAFGMAMDKATRVDPRRPLEVPSSKGIL
jgi:imidazoleglycerol-phosphate dehydratase